MSNQVRMLVLSLTVITVMLFSAVFPTATVYADEGSTPEATETGTADTEGSAEGDGTATEEATPAPEATTAAEEISPATEATAVVEEATPVPESTAVSEEATPAPEATAVPEETTAAAESTPGSEEATPAPESTSAEEPAPSSDSDSPAEEPAPAPQTSIMEQLPDNTAVTVLNAEGEAQPLASQESADAILVSDPIWCPEGLAPTPGANGCTQSYASFDELLTFLKDNEGDPAYQQAGTIYVQKDVYAGGESSVDFNSYDFQNIKNHNLTVRGGWDTGDNSLDPADTSQFGIPISIGTSSNPWGGSLTLQNIIIRNVGNQTALTLYSQGDITLMNVEATDSQTGAEIGAGGNVKADNSKFNKNKKAGAIINAGGNVEITDSEFNDNVNTTDGRGLAVTSTAAVTLTSVAANNNRLFGAYIQGTDSVIVLDSFFNGNRTVVSTCTTSCGYGLQIVTTGLAGVRNVTAEENFLFGAHLEGSDIIVRESFFSNNGSGSAQNLTGGGLEVVSTGNAALLTVEANSNQLFGAKINAVGEVAIGGPSFFSGTNAAKTRTSIGGYGLQVMTTGRIALNGVTANDNYLYGASLQGGDVAITDSFFTNNGSGSISDPIGFGLKVRSTGGIALSALEANNNQLYGADIQAIGDVAIQDSFFSGNKSYSQTGKRINYQGYGLKVITNGDHALGNVSAIGNHLFGAHLQGANMDISNSFFSNNGSGTGNTPTGKGLEVTSTDGIVSLLGVEANGNQLFGAKITAEGIVFVTGSFFSLNQSYTFDKCDCKVFHGYGLKVVTTSDIFVDTTTANGNFLWGASLTGANVEVSNSSFNLNDSEEDRNPTGRGLNVVSTGNVLLNSIEANQNQLFGAKVVADGEVTVLGSVFSGNLHMGSVCKGTPGGGNGLHVTSIGNIRLGPDALGANNEAVGNGSTGIKLSTQANVEVLAGTYNNNGLEREASGLLITAADSVTVTNVTASNNSQHGARICANIVTVTGSTFADNNGFGLSVLSDILNQSGNTYTNNGAGDFFHGSGVCFPPTPPGGGGGGGDGNQECWCVKPGAPVATTATRR